jgi:membrane associated rhomboid family serine protease
MQGTGGGVAHLTHLGGLLFGLIYMGYPYIRQRIRREQFRRKFDQKGPKDRNYYH